MNFTKEFASIEKSQVKLSVTVQKDEVRQQYAQITRKYAKELQIPGFRKGKAPVNILEQKFGDALRAETHRELMDSVLQEIFESSDKYQRPLPYVQPELKDSEPFSLEKDLSFTVVYDVFPNITVEKTDGFTITVPDVEICESDVEAELKLIQERNALVSDCADTDTLKEGHIAAINFIELDENGKKIESSKRDDFVFTVGKGHIPYDIHDDIIGMKKNEEKTIVKTYPETYVDKTLAGTSKNIYVKLTSLKERHLPAIDDELAQDVSEKYKTLADLTADIRKNLSHKISNEIEYRKINSLVKQLTEQNPFDLPESMVQAELESRWGMMAQQFNISSDALERLTASLEHGMTKEKTLAQWRPEAELRLKSRIIIEKLLDERGITVTADDVERQYSVIADSSNSSVEEVKEHYNKTLREKEYLIDEIKERKLYAQLFETAVITVEEKVSVEKFFNKGNADDGTDA